MRTSFSYLGSGRTECAENWCVVIEKLSIRFTQDGDTFSSARVTVHTFLAHLSAPARSSPKMRLTGFMEHNSVNDIANAFLSVHQ